MDNDVILVDTVQSSSLFIDLNDKDGNSSSTSSRTSLSALSCSPSNQSVEYTPKKLEVLLKQQRHRYTVVENSKCHSSKCWELFGFPALRESDGQASKVIETFVTCRQCFTTYSFNSNSTRLLNNHVCKQSHRARSSSAAARSSSSPTHYQRNLTSYTTSNVIKVSEEQINRVKDLQAQWVCNVIYSQT